MDDGEARENERAMSFYAKFLTKSTASLAVTSNVDIMCLLVSSSCADQHCLDFSSLARQLLKSVSRRFFSSSLSFVAFRASLPLNPLHSARVAFLPHVQPDGLLRLLRVSLDLILRERDVRL